jgi:hypothetical protein
MYYAEVRLPESLIGIYISAIAVLYETSYDLILYLKRSARSQICAILRTVRTETLGSRTSCLLS